MVFCIPEDGIRSHYRYLWATMWLLGTKIGTSWRAANVPNLWNISPGTPEFSKLWITSSNLTYLTHQLIFFKSLFLNCVYVWFGIMQYAYIMCTAYTDSQLRYLKHLFFLCLVLFGQNLKVFSLRIREFCLHFYLCTTCVQCPQRPEEGIGSTRTADTGGCWQEVFLTMNSLSSPVLGAIKYFSVSSS